MYTSINARIGYNIIPFTWHCTVYRFVRKLPTAQATYFGSAAPYFLNIMVGGLDTAMQLQVGLQLSKSISLQINHLNSNKCLKL